MENNNKSDTTTSVKLEFTGVDVKKDRTVFGLTVTIEQPECSLCEECLNRPDNAEPDRTYEEAVEEARLQLMKARTDQAALRAYGPSGYEHLKRLNRLDRLKS